MADFQYQPEMSDPVAQLRSAMDTMDGTHDDLAHGRIRTQAHFLVDGVLQYHIPPEIEDYTIPDPAAMDIEPQLLSEGEVPAATVRTRSNLRLFPPPLFSRQGIPQNYK